MEPIAANVSSKLLGLLYYQAMNKQFLASFLLLAAATFLLQCSVISAQPASAPAPSGPPDITKILTKAGQFSVFLKLMKNIVVANQITSQLNNSNNGLTVFAPTDNAFDSLRSGTLNSLSSEQQVELIQYHVVPTYLSTAQFQMVSNPLRTQAGGSRAFEFPMNVTTSGNQVNISTGVTNATVENAIFSDNQLAVYQVDKVLLPMSIFGPKPPPAPAPAPSKAKKKPAPGSSPDSDSVTATDVSGCRRLNVQWMLIIVGAAVVIEKFGL